ncbi:ankyrin repeat-containing domain protein [Aspergillus novoparasiticus]|uniref:Ankyrin repeat-containing domain protein n=1 Tax=Aspergillus novoparasiticus TaxID=986946 RepID=A0A5N6EF64_9EURO|nr:ankyrin repeat-containing domain protein [Aspergillus novoparasiticus]
MLLERSATIENTDIEGRTPLAGAARNGHAEVVQWLLEKGACSEPEDRHGKTPLLLAAIKGYSNTTALQSADILLSLGYCFANLELKLITRYYGANAFLPGRYKRATFRLQLLFEGEADVVKSDKIGQTPLSWALEYEHKNVI